MMLAYAIALFLILGAGMFALQAIQAHIRKDANPGRYWLWSAACLAALIVGFLVIRFF
jgi:hypothetical protein